MRHVWLIARSLLRSTAVGVGVSVGVAITSALSPGSKTTGRHVAARFRLSTCQYATSSAPMKGKGLHTFADWMRLASDWPIWLLPPPDFAPPLPPPEVFLLMLEAMVSAVKRSWLLLLCWSSSFCWLEKKEGTLRDESSYALLLKFWHGLLVRTGEGNEEDLLVRRGRTVMQLRAATRSPYCGAACCICDWAQ